MSGLPPIGDIQASKQRFQYCAQQGLLKHAVAHEKGGHGNDFSDLVKAHETLGNSCKDSGLILSLNAHIWGAIFPLLNYGTDEQQRQYLGDLLSGDSIAGHAITEPQAGSDLNNLEMTAIQDKNNFILNGRKRYITNTPIADLLIIYAQLDNKLSAFIIQADDPGANFLDSPSVSGCRTATMGDVVLDGCTIPQVRQLGKTGAGNMMIQQAMELERAFIFAGIQGIIEQQLKTVIKFSRERKIHEVSSLLFYD